jgi:hypothetical protein
MMEAEMTQRKRLILAGGLSVAMLLASPLAVAQTAAEVDSSQDGTNVVIHFRMGLLEGKKRTTTKSYTLVVAAGSMGSQLLAGQRVPFESGGPEDAVTYQNIGFATDVKAWVIGDNKIKRMADIAGSRVRESEEGELPIVETRQLTVNAILTEGVPLELTRAEGLTDRSGYVEVEARIQE